MREIIFTIGEVADLLNITPKTIRYYHSIGLLDQPKRDVNNYRLYDFQQIEQLLQIMHLKHLGLSLKQIKTIVHGKNPDRLAQTMLRQHARALADEICRLQQELNLIEDLLDTRTNLADQSVSNTPSYSAMTVLSEAIRPHASAISDILVEVETDTMATLDRFDWDENYELFWHHAGKHFINTLDQESLFIFWMERYLAMATMHIDDLQGNAWLDELKNSPARKMLAKALVPHTLTVMPDDDQEKIYKLLPMLLYQHAEPLQKQFLQILRR